MNANFDITAKRIDGVNISCEYCPFVDCCYKTDKDIVELKGKSGRRKMKMPMNDMQYLAAYGDFDKDVLVSAGAGSGKTQVLTSRVTNLIEKGVKPTELLVLTFTNAAAAEMKSRVRGMLSERQDLRDSISLLEQAYITTFDSFNLSMCKKYFYALNVSPNIGICDASSMKIKKIEIIDDILNELYEAHDDALEDYLNNFTDKRDDILRIIF